MLINGRSIFQLDSHTTVTNEEHVMRSTGKSVHLTAYCSMIDLGITIVV